MTVISLAQTKLFLGLSDTTYDAQITAMLPIIDAKVKQICRNNFETQLLCKTVNGSATVGLYGVVDQSRAYNVWPTPEMAMLMKDLPTGTTISGDGIPDDSYIAGVEYSGVSHDSVYLPSFSLNANATASDDDVYLKAGINTAYWPVIAKGIWWLISQTSTTITDDTWISKSFGPVSVTKGGSEKLDGKSGMPLWFVRSLQRYM